MAWKLGIEGNLFVGTAGATPSTPVTGISGDLTLNIEPVEANSSVREIDFELTDVVRFKVSIEFEMQADEENASFATIWAAFIAREKLAFKVESFEGGKGFDADFSIGVKWMQPHEGHQRVQVTLKPAYSSSHPPVFV